MRKAIVVLFAMILCVWLLSSCNSKDNTTAVTTSDAYSTVSSGKTAQTGTTANAESTAQQFTSAVSISAEETTVNAQPSTTAEIVSLFNKAANRVKLTKPGYQFTTKANADEKNIIISQNVPLHSFISKFIASKINSTKADLVTVKKGENHDAYPVKGETWASKLEATALKSASCADKGSCFEIVLKFNDEKLKALPDNPETTAHGKAFSLLLSKDFTNAFGGFDVNLLGLKVGVENQKFEPTYRGSYIKCKIDKAGNMMNALYYLNTYSIVDMLVTVNSKDYIIGITMVYSVTEEYTFN
jgi:hypothetical protein